MKGKPEDLRVLTRDVTPTECRWLRQTYVAGETVYLFRGATYGCINSAVGEACSADGDNPFFELPRDALSVVKS